MKPQLIIGIGLAISALSVACGDSKATQDVSTTPAERKGTTPALDVTTATGLTDTGYTAPDGRPLYKECIDPSLSLPPVYPSPSGTSVAPATRPSSDAMPSPGVVIPDFDPLQTAPADRAGWTPRAFPCAAISFAHPRDLIELQAFKTLGYQQEFIGSIGKADRSFVIEVHAFATPADFIGLVTSSPPADGESRLVSNRQATVGGAPGVVTYSTVDDAYHRDEVMILYTASPWKGWYVQVAGYFAPPFDEARFATLNSFVDSLKFDHAELTTDD